MVTGINVKSIDVVTSALNEELCIKEFLDRTVKVLERMIDVRYRIIVMDNGSHDSTWSIIREEASKNENIVGLRLSRTFSFDSALTCGLDHAVADYVVLMTSDLQDPPEMIPYFFEAIQNGHDQVVGYITDRNSVPWLRRQLSKMFYRIASRTTNGMIPESVSDFRIMNRKAYSSVRQLRESHRFLRGLNAWIGFNTLMLPMKRPERFAGQSKWLSFSLLSVISHGVRSIFANSARPLLFVAGMSFLLSISTFLSLPALIFFWISYGVPFTGFGWLTTLLLMSFAGFMMGISVLSLYIANIYEEVKNRPLYIVDEELNLRGNFP